MGHVTLRDESTWDKQLPQFAVSGYITQLQRHNWPASVRHVYPAVGIDNDTRREQDNVLNIDSSQIQEYRSVNKALSMELLCSLLLTHLAHPIWVRSWCEIRREGRPHRYAPSRSTDITAGYPASGGTKAFGLIAEVSAKREISVEFYKTQLSQALKYALQLDGKKAECYADMPTYSLLINGGKIGSNKKLQKLYRSFVQRNNLQPDGPVRIIPMYSSDIMVALQRLENKQGIDQVSFGADKLVMIFNKLQAGLLQAEQDEDPDWMCNVWEDTLTPRQTRDFFTPGNPE